MHSHFDRVAGRAFSIRLSSSAMLLLVMLVTADARVFFVSRGEGDGANSLRGAVCGANRRGGYNVIFLTSDYYRLSAEGNPDTDHTGDLDITNGRVMICGIGSSAVISGAFTDRIFHVHKGARLSLRNLTIHGGNASHDPGVRHGHDGGGVLNEGELVMRNCRVTNNSAGLRWTVYPGWGAPGQGGGIYNAGSVHMTSCELVGNWSLPSGILGEGGKGAALFNSGSAILKECTIYNNSAGFGREGLVSAVPGPSGSGGGIYNEGKMLVQSSTVCSNSTPHGANAGPAWTPPFNQPTPPWPGGNGAGICNAGVLYMVLCTVSANICGAGGNGYNGYIANDGAAGGSGGGIYNSGTLSLTSCTVCENRAGSGGSGARILYNPNTPTGGAGGNGGGIFSLPGGGCSLKNTLIALNVAGSPGPGGSSSVIIDRKPVDIPGTPGRSGSGPDFQGNPSEIGWCLVGIVEEMNSIQTMQGNLFGTPDSPLDPRVSPLQNNGGATWTHMPLENSPLLDAGRALGLTTDQRGNQRLRNLSTVINAVSSDGTDIGAVELTK